MSDAELVADLLAALKALRDLSYGNPSYPDETRRVDAMADAAIAQAESQAKLDRALVK